MDLNPYRVTDGRAFDLARHRSDDTAGWDEEPGRTRTGELNDRLRDLQALLWAGRAHKVLVVLQAIDAGGKDGTIRNVFRGVNPSGVRVAGFTQPSHVELAHDYLWRVHAQTPADGQMAIFNRSHYEDVLVVRVEELVPAERWQRRYHHIVEFERLLADEGTTIVKLFLHISKREQRRRLQKRLDNPAKRWKFEPADLESRLRWDDYQEAFTEAIARTASPHAPWYVVPGDRKWFRNLVVSEILVQTLEGLELSLPEPAPGLDDLVID